MRASLVTLAGCLVALTCLAGCGGSDSPADTFRTQANAICKDGNDAIDEVSKDFGPDGPTPEQLAVAAPRVPQLMTHELDRLDALDVPQDLAADVASMLATFRAVVATMQQEGTAFFERTDEPFAPAYAKAKALGLDDCAH